MFVFPSVLMSSSQPSRTFDTRSDVKVVLVLLLIHNWQKKGGFSRNEYTQTPASAAPPREAGEGP